MSNPAKRGRPVKPESDRFDLVHVRLPKPMVRKIDQYRATLDDAPDRSTAIRQFIAAGLVAKGLTA